MIEARNEQEWVVRFEDGEDVIGALLELHADSALILEGIGMVRGAVLGYWNGETYEEHVHEAPAELVCLQGNLAVGESGERIAHAHVTLAHRDGSVSGGHLLRAIVHNTVELGLLPLAGIALERRAEASGLVGLAPRAT